MAPNHHIHDLRLNHDDANAQECHKLHGVHFTDDGSARFSMTERSLPNSLASRARHRGTPGLMAREEKRGRWLNRMDCSQMAERCMIIPPRKPKAAQHGLAARRKPRRVLQPDTVRVRRCRPRARYSGAPRATRFAHAKHKAGRA